MPTAVVISPEIPDSSSGAPIVTLGILRALKRLGYDVSFLHDHPREFDPAWLPPAVRLVPRPKRWYAPLFQAIGHVIRFLGAGFTAQWRSETWLALRDEVRHQTPDLVVLDSLRTAEYGRLLKRIGYRGRLVLNEHNVHISLAERQRDMAPGWGKKLELTYRAHRFRRVESALREHADACLALTTVDQAVLQQMNPGYPVIFAPPAVDLERYIAREALPDTQELLFIGSCKWEPNRDAILWFAKEIWPLIRAAIPTAHLTVVGKSPPDELQGQPGITVTGFVDDERPYYERARVVIAPIRWGSGVRLKILTALAMARPTVSTTLGAEGIPLVSGESIELADDPAAYAEKVLLLLRDRAHALAVAEKGRTVCEQWYSNEAMDRSLLEAIRGS